MMRTWSFVLFSLLVIPISAQYVGSEIGDRYEIFVEKIQAKYKIDLGTHTTVHPFNLKNAFGTLDSLSTMFDAMEMKEWAYLKKQHDIIAPEEVKSEVREVEEGDGFYTIETPAKATPKPFLKYFYTNRNHFLSLDKGNFSLRADPVIDLGYSNASNDNNLIFRNTRGVKITGIIDNKVLVHTSIFENQANFPAYVNRFVTENFTIPRNGFYKSYRSSVIDNLKGWDYLNAQAFIGVPISKNIQIEFGHGRNFIGNGVRSLLLSDFGNNYLYLKFNAQFWKFHYQTIYGELSAVSAQDRYSPDSAVLPKKYTANHYLSFRPNQNFEVGLFETVVFGRKDHLELQYLNPVILYRTIEQFLNSPDNVLLGLNMAYVPVKKVKLYGQFVLDEFLLQNIKDQNGWWGNKYGLQLGVKLYDVVPKTNIGLEYNAVRPYTYTHYQSIDTTIGDKSISSYSHYNQALAHPLGANFREWIVTVDHAITPKIKVNSTLFLWNKGLDAPGENNGGNIFLNYRSRNNDFGNYKGQGISNKVVHWRSQVSYEFFPNMMADINLLYRRQTSQPNTFLAGIGLRINMATQNYDF